MLRTDAELVKAVLDGEKQIFAELVKRYERPVRAVALDVLNDYHLAADISQETFVKAFIHADKYKTIAKFSTWLYTIATNLVRNRMRSKKRAPQIFSLWHRHADGDGDEKQIDVVDTARQPDTRYNDKELGGIINDYFRFPEDNVVSIS